MKSKKKITKKNMKRNNAGVMPAMIVVACVCCAMVLGSVILDGRTTKETAQGLRISEVMTDNRPLYTLEGAAEDWIEIENASDKAVNLAGYALLCTSDPSKVFVFPNATLEAGGFVVVHADGSMQAQKNGEYHAPFRLPASGEQLVLLNKNGGSQDEVDIPELAMNEVYCRDAADGWQKSAAATPGSANRISDAANAAVVFSISSGALEITEVMTNNASRFPDENGLCPDYVEIHNATDAPVSLKGWYLSDDDTALSRWQFPEMELAADGYLVVHCSGNESTSDTAHLHAGFRLSDGEKVYLTAPDGTIVSAVGAPVLNPDQSYSLTEAGWTSMMIPTPGYSNDQTGADMAESVRSAQGLMISEIVTTAPAMEDWIEIYNGSSQTVDLSGYGLSDNAGRPRKWQFPEGTTVQPGGYYAVLATGSGSGNEANFRMAPEGGYSVTLSDPDGKILDSLFVTRQYGDLSYGRPEGQRVIRYFSAATPNAANSGAGNLGRAEAPEYSVEGGLYAAGQTLSVEITAAPGSRIHYTTDNTDPDESSALYTGPISISQTTVLRTRVYQEGRTASFVDTQSYIFNAKNGGGSVYVVSVVSDPYNLTSDEAGIMVRGSGSRANYMQDWERDAHVEIYDQQGRNLLSQACGITLQGQTCRADPQQAFKLIARSIYGESMFRGDLFTKNDFTEWNTLLLRPSNDDATKTRMRDSILSGLAIETSLLYQETEVCVVYLNGEYWGHYNLREGVNPELICRFEGWVGDEDVIDLVVGNDAVMQGSNATFEALQTWMKKNDCNTEAAYQAIDSVIDIDNYIDYMCFQICVGNTDPSNIKRYRNAEADGKWRWIVFDMDWAFNQDTNSINRWLTPGGVGNGKRTDNSFFIACMKNYAFRDKFLARLGELMSTTFAEAHVVEKFQERYELLMTILPDHFERWGTSESEYNKEVRRLVAYANKRTDRLLQFLKIDDHLRLNQSQFEHYFGTVMAQQGVTYAQIPD